MARRALLIGSQTGGLTGVHADVELMRATLEGLGFGTTTVTGSDATRDGILGAYGDLIGSTTAGDAVVVYYAGHGGRCPNPLAAEDPEAPPYLQYVVPTDFDDAADDEFRGVLAEELSLRQAELTSRTANVTTVLDCCHAARMSRSPARLPRARPPRWVPVDAVRATFEAARSDPAAGRIASDSNPLAVRVVACAPDQSAYELTLPDGSRHGALTARLCALLGDRESARLTWHQLVDGLRPAVMDLVELQRPEVEGPTERRLFTTDERPATGVLPVVVDDGTPYLLAPSLFGVAEGDTYSLVAAGGDPGEPLAQAVVDRVQTDRARLVVEHGALDGAAARIEGHPVGVALGRRPVCVPSPTTPRAQQVVEALRRSPHTRVVEPGTPGLLATVEVDDEGLRLLDAAGEPLSDGSRALDDDALASLTRDVLQLARAAHLRDLPSGQGDAALPDDVTVEWLRLDGDREVALGASGEHLFDGDVVAVRLRNRSPEQRFASVFDIGLRGAITLLSTSEPSGLTLAPGDVHELFLDPPGRRGMEMFWPPDLPGPAARPETFVTVVTDRRQDLSRLRQAGVSRAPDESPRSPLEQLVDAVSTGVVRHVRPRQAPATVRYRVARHDVFLHPVRRVVDDEPDFAIDERPDVSFRLVVPRSDAAPPGHVSVRLRDVVVRSGREALASAVRVDAMVLTRLGRHPGTPSRATTLRLDRRGEGDRPRPDAVLFEGPASEFLDLALWVGGDEGRRPDLGVLLQQAGVDAAPDALVAAAAAPHEVASAVAALVRTGAALLDEAGEGSTGVYRTSLLEHERFGAGDATGGGARSRALRTPDLAFVVEVAVG